MAGGGLYGDPTNNWDFGYGQSMWSSGSLSTTVSEGSSKGALTNLTGLIDAWGKPIPYTWGSIRVGGVGIWGSNFYENIEKFKTTTEYYNDYLLKDGVYNQADTQANLEITDTKVTTSDKTDYAIDLAYSFGFEGTETGERKLIRLRMNGKIIYDVLTGYVEPGLGFSVRYGTKSDVIDPIMKQYEDTTGKYYYPGQTYVIFEKFIPANWGNTLPVSIDAEFAQEESLGAAETVLFPPTTGKVYDPGKMIYYPERRKVFYVDVEDDGVTPALHVFDLNTGTRLENVPMSGPAMTDFVAAYDGLYQENSINIGLFDARVFSRGGFATTFVIDLRSGRVDYIAQFVFCHSFLLWQCNQDGATVYHWRFISVSSGNRITLARENGLIVSTFAYIEDMPSPVTGGYGYVDGDGEGFAVLSVTSGNNNNVVIWDGKTGPGIRLEYGQDPSDTAPSGWRVMDVMAFQKQAYVLVSRGFDQTDSKLMRFNRAGVLQQERLTGIAGNVGSVGQHLSMLKGPKEGRRSIPGNTYIGGIQPGNGAGNNNTIAVILNLKTMGLTFFNTGRGISNAPFDPLATKLYFSESGDGSGQTGLVGPGFVGARISLFEFMRSLYVLSGVYERTQVTQDGTITDSIAGAMIINNSGVDQMVQAICTLYHINKVDTVNGVYFFKTRNSAEGLVIALQLDIEDLAADPEETDESQVLKTSRANVNLTPSQIDLRFIDPNNEYKENSVSWRRTNAGIIRGQVASLALPFVMTQSEALRLVQSAIIDGETRVHSHSFRLAPRHALKVVPGDIIQIRHGDYRETIQITGIDLNGDYSGSCTGVTVVDETVVEIKTPPYVPPAPINLGNPVKAVGYVIDSPTLVPSDDPGTGFVTHYLAIGPAEEGQFNGGYFGRRLPPSGDWEALPTIKSSVPLTVYAAKAAAPDKKWLTDYTPFPVTRLSGRNPTTRTNAELQADRTLNMAFFGKPGRWEIIQIEKITGGTIVGISRGLRGTEVFAGMHEVGDLIIMANNAMLLERKALDKVDIEEEYRPVSAGLPFGAAVSLPTYKLKGLSAYPFAPANLSWTVEGNGDITIKWERRDRLGSGWGLSNIPQTDPSDYRITIYNAAGTTKLRDLDVVGAETVTYSSAMQATDGTTGATFLNIAAAQKGQLGYGLSRMVKIDG